MILSINQSALISTTTSGSILQGGTNSSIAQISNELFQSKGIFIIKGFGQIVGNSNPSNTVADVLSLVSLNPFISQSSDIIFTKVFINQSFFDFELTFNPSHGTIISKCIFDDGTIVLKTTSINISQTFNIDLGLQLSTASGLYQILVYSVYAEYKKFFLN